MKPFLLTPMLWSGYMPLAVVAMSAAGAELHRSGEPTSAVVLSVEQGPLAGRRIALQRSPFTIGRDSENDLILPETAVSRRHARIVWQAGRWRLEDLGSTNGVFLNRQRLTDSPPLHDGDLIGIGDSVFLFQSISRQPAASVPPRKAAPALSAGVWLSRIMAVIASILLVAGALGDWLRLQVSLPILGEVVDRTFRGADSHYGWLLLGVALVALVLVLLDIVSRRWGLATGLGQTLLGGMIAALMLIDAYSYYRAAAQNIFGISLLDVFERYARDLVQTTVGTGLYLVAAGLIGLITAGVLRMILASTD